ncbi:uncharacterized protein LOC120112344 [Phoenix dactylifera]|uniref:Uncharacterized protein LOC120112344 n=1 Tax=Phoenix dactylifera TaxID=42345 RepID=A0A8B9AKS4_PHODC|nr:uncharacterized protein LOC120112344 [Phoenix dactylifera]
MAEMEEGLRDPEQQEEEQPWEERTLSRLQDSKIDQGPPFPMFPPPFFLSFFHLDSLMALSLSFWRVSRALRGEGAERVGGKKHKVKWMKRPMTMPQAIIEFLDEDLRENASRYLSNYLVEMAS